MTFVVDLESGSTARPSGLAVGELRWGSHLCHFFETVEDLSEVLVPYFAAGLRANERCVWVTAEPLSAAEARAALARELPDLDQRIAAGQIDVLAYEDWYAKLGAGGFDGVLAAWLELEARAVADGYDGLRITGNTTWLQPADWRSFSAYEARVHQAFHGRRILTICSYSLARLDDHEILDVVENHDYSLARLGGSWQAVESATTLIAARELGGAEPPAREPAPADPHAVCFFRQDDFPAARVAEHLVAGIASGAGASAYARPAHLDAIGAALVARGVDVDAALAAGSLRLVDAEKLARAIAEPGRAEGGDLEELFTLALSARASASEPARVYGETVDLFVRAGDPARALELERWWEGVLRSRPVAVLCGYALESFSDADSVEVFRRVCAAHDSVEPASGETRGDGRLLAELQQSMTALWSEARQRRESEKRCEGLRVAERTARLRAEAATQQLVRLQRVMSALSEVTRPGEVARVVAGELARAVGAERAHLVIDGGEAGERELRQPAELSASTRVPLVLRGRRLGAIELRVAPSAERSPMRRALVADCARQVAFALDRALSHEAAERERERAEQASRAKDEFLAMLGHELRNPLAPIVTALDVMKLSSAAPPSNEQQIIERHVQHMSGLVDDLMDIARVTRGMLSLRTEPLEIAAVVARAVEMVAPLLESKQHQLSVAVPETGLRTLGDAGRLTQVVSNLLTNAARYSPSGCQLTLSAERDGDELVLRVADRGDGIEPALLPGLFEPFRQGRPKSDGARGGLGLGLALVRSLVELHGGSVSAHSDGPGQGSEFAVRLPMLAEARASEAASERPSGGGEAQPRRLRVLLVDDNEDAAEMLALVLRRRGHQVLVAHDGPQALRAVAGQRPDAAVLDIGLPVMDGYELAQRLRRDLGDGLHLVALTGYGQESDVARSRAAGFAVHLVKPVQSQRLLEALDELLAGAQA